MRVNIYAEELTERVEVISKVIDGHTYNAVRFYMELPATVMQDDLTALPVNVRGPFIHRPGDDDSAAVTFWGRTQLRSLFVKAILALDAFEASRPGSMTGVELDTVKG